MAMNFRPKDRLAREFEDRRPLGPNREFDDRRPASNIGKEFEDRRPPSVVGREFEDRRPPPGIGRDFEDRRPPLGMGRDFEDRRPTTVMGRDFEDRRSLTTIGREFDDRRPPQSMGRDFEDRSSQNVIGGDPKLAECRIYVGNLAPDKVTQGDLEDKFSKYGKIIGVSIHQGFAYVQYLWEEEAQRAVTQENGVFFKGTRIEVSTVSDRYRRGGAGRGRWPSPPSLIGDRTLKERGRELGYDMYARDLEGPLPRDPVSRDRSPLRDSYEERFQDGFRREPRREDRLRDDPFRPPLRYSEPYRDLPLRSYDMDVFPERRNEPRADMFKLTRPDIFPERDFARDLPPKVNDCEIIVINKQQRLYAEAVERRLKSLGMTVDMLFLKDQALLIQTVEDVARRGSLYAVVVTADNEVHNSVILNILHGSPQEHRNIPLEDAMKLLSRNFHDFTQSKQFVREKIDVPGSHPELQPVPTPDKDISFLLNLLADGKYLSVKEIDRLIKYLHDRKEKLLGIETRQSGKVNINAPDTLSKPREDQPGNPQDELQKRILNLINQGAPPPTSVSVISQPAELSNPPSTYINFDNPSVQKALDSLIQTGPNLLKSISLSTGTSATSSIPSSSEHLYSMPPGSIAQASQSTLMSLSQLPPGFNQPPPPPPPPPTSQSQHPGFGVPGQREGDMVSQPPGFMGGMGQDQTSLMGSQNPMDLGIGMISHSNNQHQGFMGGIGQSSGLMMGSQTSMDSGMGGTSHSKNQPQGYMSTMGQNLMMGNQGSMDSGIGGMSQSKNQPTGYMSSMVNMMGNQSSVDTGMDGESQLKNQPSGFMSGMGPNPNSMATSQSAMETGRGGPTHPPMSSLLGSPPSQPPSSFGGQGPPSLLGTGPKNNIRHPLMGNQVSRGVRRGRGGGGQRRF
ncbi:uncharacterized protein LOC143237470 isoform X2 [Tachypleus tridentatus]